jgi:two-component system NarL family response regulator
MVSIMPKDSEITVVIIDDRESKRMQLKRSLGNVKGVKVTGEASTWKMALDKAMHLRPKVIVVDAGAHEVDSIKLAKQIHEELPDTGIMMMASQGYGIDIIAAIAAGANAFCSKDASDDQIEMAMKTVASGGAWLDHAIATRVLQAATAGAESAANENKIQEIRCRLSQRESEVLCLVVDGQSNHDIAATLSISSETVKTHIRHIIEKLGVHSRTEAAVFAIQEHLTAGMD